MSEKSNHMENRIVIAGSGGQGILSAGKMLCRSCLTENKNVTFMPSYGSEVRGGTANCHIVVSDAEIASPAVYSADAMVILNEPSLRRFGNYIKPEGLLLMNSTLINNDNIDIITKNARELEATSLAAEIGNVIVTNIIMLGAFVKITNICQLQTLEEVISEWFEEKGKTKNIDINIEALHKGAEYV